MREWVVNDYDRGLEAVHELERLSFDPITVAKRDEAGRTCSCICTIYVRFPAHPDRATAARARWNGVAPARKGAGTESTRPRAPLPAT